MCPQMTSEVRSDPPTTFSGKKDSAVPNLGQVQEVVRSGLEDKQTGNFLYVWRDYFTGARKDYYMYSFVR